MTPTVDPAALNEVRNFASRQFGLRFGDDKQDFLKDTLLRRLEATGADSVDHYVRLLLQAPAERQALMGLLTVPETYFFRGADQLRAFQDAVLPDRLRQRRHERTLRILSAGCATGEEPYTIAMILRDSFPELETWAVGVSGYDLVPRHLEIARAGRYSSWSMRETPPETRDRCFRREGSAYLVHDVYRERVAFREVNLSAPPPDAFPPGAFDVIFCRNVIMYFTPQTMAAVVGHLAAALVPGGYLFLGHAETLRGLTSQFALRHTHETFYYQRRDGKAPAAGPAEFAPDPGAALPPELPPAAPDESWMDSIRTSSERMETLYQTLDRPPAPAGEPSPQERMASALDLLRRERFQEALAVVAPLAARRPRDPEALLLQAILLSHCGRATEAEALCREILNEDDTSAEAHHLCAICREQAGDLRGAIEQDQMAQYLDPSFAMPRLHVGRMERQQANLPAARRELSQALALLAREDPRRILLFGGGFAKEALIQICRAELDSCGEGS